MPAMSDTYFSKGSGEGGLAGQIVVQDPPPLGHPDHPSPVLASKWTSQHRG